MQCGDERERPSNDVGAPAGENDAAAQEAQQQQQRNPRLEKHCYCCRKCRTPLFDTDEIVPHESAKGAAGHKRFKHQSFHADTDGSACTSYFLDPDASPWVSEESRALHRDALHRDADDKEEEGGGDLEKRKDDALKRGDFETYLHLEGLAAESDLAAAAASAAAATTKTSDDDDDEVLTSGDEARRGGAAKGRAAAAAQRGDDRRGRRGGSRIGLGRVRQPPTSATYNQQQQQQPAGGAVVVDPDTIYCPNTKCRTKIGTQSWVGSQCSCGAWVTPSFKIHMSKVDAIPLWL